MKFISVVIGMLTCVGAFNTPAPQKDVSFLTSKVGSTAPVPAFDPLNLSGDKPARFNYYREAELKHGRLGMFASVAIPLIESNTHKPALDQFQQLDPTYQATVIATMLGLEFYGMKTGWENPTKKMFALKEDYRPGDFGFKIVKNWDSDFAIDLQNKELNNGRLAMLSAAGMIAQELVHPVPLLG